MRPSKLIYYIPGLVMLVILFGCVQENTPRPLITLENEFIRQTTVAKECAAHPERCLDDFSFNPWRDDPSCEPPSGEEIDWSPPAHCFTDSSSLNNGDSSSNGGDVNKIDGCPEGCTYHKSGCDIKGNISFETGEKIYHKPGQEYYKDAKINSEKGERWFCTEQEAKANGWRKSKE